MKKIIIRNKRIQDKIKNALSLKPSKHMQSKGPTPEEIKKTLTPQKQNEVKPKPAKRIVGGKFTRKKIRGDTVVRRNNSEYSEISYLEIQNLFNNSKTLQTPDWFKVKYQPKVSIIVPLYKSKDVIIEQINSWQWEDIPTEIIYVDDRCPEKTKEVIVPAWEQKSKRPIGKIIACERNNGYGWACNLGAYHASGEYLIFLNADTKVSDDFIQPMLNLFDIDNVGIVGNLQLKDGGKLNLTVDGAGSEWSWGNKCFNHIGRHSYRGQEIPKPFSLESCPPDILTVAEREMVTGCCFMIPKQLFHYIGGFDYHYRVGYWEDTEICMSIRELGYKIMFQPNSVIYHKVGHSGGHAYLEANRLYFANKWINSGRIDKLVKAKRLQEPVKSILVRREAAHGDVLLATAILPALKKKYPQAEIYFQTKCKEVLNKNPYVKQTFSLRENKAVKLNLNLDLAYELRTKKSILQAYADQVGVDIKDCQPFIYDEEFDIKYDNYIVFHSGKKGWIGCQWSMDKFNTLIQEVKKLGYNTVCVGHGSDNVLDCDLNLVGLTTIAQLANVIKKAKIFIGVDSFPMQIAQCLGIPGFAFFGSVNPNNILCLNKNSIKPIYNTSLDCIGCHNNKPYPAVNNATCLRGDLACETTIMPEDFLKNILELKI